MGEQVDSLEDQGEEESRGNQGEDVGVFFRVEIAPDNELQSLATSFSFPDVLSKVARYFFFARPQPQREVLKCSNSSFPVLFRPFW